MEKGYILVKFVGESDKLLSEITMSGKQNLHNTRQEITNNGWVDNIAEKGEINFDYPYIGLCGIKDYKLFWDKLEELPQNSSLSDVHVINEMLNTVTFNFHKINNWLDIGNTTELNKTREYFSSSIKVLDKDNELIEEVSSSKILEMIEDNTITEGMIPKINTCLDAINNKVTAVAIIDGRKKHSVLFEIFSDKGSGTLIRK